MRKNNPGVSSFKTEAVSGGGPAANSDVLLRKLQRRRQFFMKKKTLILSISGIFIFIAASLYAGTMQKTPTTATLDSLSDKYNPVIFDHAKHTALAGNCGTCHHEHGDFGALPCKECHALDPSVFRNSVVNNFMACKNCHGSYDPSNPRMPGLKTAYHQQCFKCHRGMGDVGISPAGCTTMCHGKRGPNTQKVD
jgi:hypothetical protein